MAKKPSPKAEKVRKYIRKNKLATPAEVAKATGVSYGYVRKVMREKETPAVHQVLVAKAKENETPVRPILIGVLVAIFAAFLPIFFVILQLVCG